MTQEPIIFTMTAVPRLRGEQLFLSHIDQILANGAGAAVFSIIDIANGTATRHPTGRPGVSVSGLRGDLQAPAPILLTHLTRV
jgi:hypothetical protein